MGATFVPFKKPTAVDSPDNSTLASGEIAARITTEFKPAKMPRKIVPCPSSVDLSILFGTYNRRKLLEAAVESFRQSAEGLTYEIIVCDGGSTDGSREWLAAQPDVILIGERHMEGAVKAFNQCFVMSRGAFIAAMNDDCTVEGKALFEGVEYMRKHGDVGQVAFAFKGGREDWHTVEVHPGTESLYVNFGITRREAARQAAIVQGGFWHPAYRTYGGDSELSCWIRRLGWKVEALPHLHVVDVRQADDLRLTNESLLQNEVRLLHRRWPKEAFAEGGKPCVPKAEFMRLASISPNKKRVVSLALWGTGDKYTAYLPAAIRAHHNLYPGWDLRIHYGAEVKADPYFAVLEKLEAQGLIELRLVEDLRLDGNVMIDRAMLWRLMPLWDKDVELFLIRDIDAIPGCRERSAVETWLRSGLAVHSMSDKAKHHDFPTLGGMMGFRVEKTRELLGLTENDRWEDLLSRTGWTEAEWSREHNVSNESTNNQHFLAAFVWPRVQAHACEHRLSGSKTFPGTGASYRDVSPLDESSGIPAAIRNRADTFFSFIGSGDLDVATVVDFYAKYGNPETERVIAECEGREMPAAPIVEEKPASVPVVIPPPVKLKAKLPRGVCIADVPDWAFDVNEHDMAEYLKEQFDFAHVYMVQHKKFWVPKLNEFDFVFLPYHRWDINPFLPWQKTLGSLRSYSFAPERTSSCEPTESDVTLVNRFAGFHLVTEANYNAVKARCPNAVYLTNPVNTRRFSGNPTDPSQVVFSWNGNSGHHNPAQPDVKGLHTIITPAIEQTKVPLVTVDYQSNRKPHGEMPAFYRTANVAICASLYEGASNSIMEAMAMGLAVISTRVGNMEELDATERAIFGDSGIVFIDRNPESLAEVISKLAADPHRVEEMGCINQTEIQHRWSWAVWAERYANFIKKALR